MKRKAKNNGTKRVRARKPPKEKIRIVLTQHEFGQLATAAAIYDVVDGGPLHRLLWERRFDCDDARDLAFQRRLLSACGVKRRDMAGRLREYRASLATRRAQFFARFYPMKETASTVDAPSGEEAGRG